MAPTISISNLAADLAREGSAVMRARVDARTHELALLAGRAPPHVTQNDYEQAKREVTGESDSDRQDAVLARQEKPEKKGRARRTSEEPS